MGMESAMSPDDQTMIVATYQQRQSGVNATVVELQRSPPGSTLPSRTVSILLGEFLLVNDTQTDEILPPQFDESIDTGLPTCRCRRWRRFSSVRRRCSPPSGCGSGLTMSAEETTLSSTTSGGHRHVPQHPTPVMCHLRPRHRCRQPLVEPGRIRQHPGQHTPSVLCHVVAADFDPQILRPIADSPHLSGALPP